MAVAASLAIVGIAFGVIAMKDVLGPAREGTPNQIEHEARKLAVLRPDFASGKASAAAKEKDTAVAQAPPPTQHHPAPAPPPKPKPAANNACDPPYTIDPTNGRKKYKLECLK